MWANDRGDVILSGMLNTVLFLLVTALVVYEIGAVVVNAIQLDDVANDASRVAAQAAGAGASDVRLEQTVRDYLALHMGTDGEAVLLDGITKNHDTVTISVSREPRFLVAERLPGVEGRFTGRSSHTVSLP